MFVVSKQSVWLVERVQWLAIWTNEVNEKITINIPRAETFDAKLDAERSQTIFYFRGPDNPGQPDWDKCTGSRLALWFEMDRRLYLSGQPFASALVKPRWRLYNSAVVVVVHQ